MANLGRINLLVGTNNCGKTSILEAIHLLSTRGDASSLWSVLGRRGESLEGALSSRDDLEADICHLFHGHQLTPGKFFSIQGKNDALSEALVATIVEANDSGDSDRPNAAEIRQKALAFDDAEVGLPSRLALAIRWQRETIPIGEQLLLLSRQGGMRSSAAERATRRRGREDEDKPIQLITTASLTRHEVMRLFDDIVLGPEERVLVEALRIIEPTIERIAAIGSRQLYSLGARGGFVIICQGSTQRIPIGSMGDGIWRMLGIVLSLMRVPNGTLLVDEIDTGLHYTVLANMWKVVLETAKRLNVQVFATTHSRDCYESLAEISRPQVVDKNEVSIQRIERDRKEAVAYSEQEIVIAAESGIEVR